MIKLALCLIVKPTDDEAIYLKQCLKYIADYVDGIFITITGENKKVEDVCKMYNANISHFEWCNHFAKARNYNFSQVTNDYTHILWLDADDVVRGAELIKDTIEEHDKVDCFSMNYLYAFDEWKNPIVVHPKTRIVKNDGCVEWNEYAGNLHEDFKDTRDIERFFIKGIEILHMTNDGRRTENSKRNLEIAKQQVKDFSKDARSYWNLANSYKSLFENEKALEVFEKFIQLSNSDDEKYIAYLRMAESLWALDKKADAISKAKYAIGTKPQYPDAYHLLGSLYFESGQMEKAKEFYMMGLVKKPKYMSIIVYNPRDYDYVPLMNLAKVYFNLNLPTLAMECLKGCLKIYPKDENIKNIMKMMKKEVKKFDNVTKLIKKLEKIKDDKKLKKELDKIPTEFKSHPAVCVIRNTRFIKKESSGKDISIYCGYTEKEWTPKTAKEKGVGGSEEAVIHLSSGLVKKGWNVTVYNNCGHIEQDFDGVKYKPLWMWNYRDKQDITILWRSLKGCDYPINSDKVFVDLHDALREGEITEQRMKQIDKIFVKSEFHRSLYPNISDDKFEIIPNGIVKETFDGDFEKEPFLMINTSSPDRGLRCLVDMFKEVKKQVPEAKLKWAYGWDVFDIVHGDDLAIMSWKEKLVKDMERTDGIEILGRVNHKEVAKLYQRGSVFAYPSEFAEIDCISLTKAMASGCVPVTTDFSAMGGKKGHGGIFIPSNKTKDTWCQPNQFDFSIENDIMKRDWIDNCVKVLKEKQNTQKMREYALNNYNWELVVDKWDNVLKK